MKSLSSKHNFNLNFLGTTPLLNLITKVHRTSSWWREVFNVSLIASIIIMTSCTKSLPELKGIDLNEWRRDKNGCERKRAVAADALVSQKNELLALTEAKIIKLLGKPDQNELYKRNQKFYHYFISPGPECNSSDSVSVKLIVRFNALGLAQEVSIE